MNAYSLLLLLAVDLAFFCYPIRRWYKRAQFRQAMQALPIHSVSATVAKVERSGGTMRWTEFAIRVESVEAPGLPKLGSVRLYLAGEESHERERVAKNRLASVIQAKAAYVSRQEPHVVVLVPDFSPQLKKHVHGVFGSALVLLAAIVSLAIATA